MNEDTRLRDGLEARANPSGAVAGGHAARNGVYAALDLGTNNCRLLIACPTGDSFRVFDSFSRIIRLGEGVSATGSISEAAIDRAIAALSICRDKIRYRKAQRLRLIATEACRAASNAEGFRDRVAAETGIRLEVIDRETEAALAVIGCSPLLDPKGRGAILFDIGGGSTELVRIERDPAERTRCRGSRRGCRFRRRRHAGRAIRRPRVTKNLCADGTRGRATCGAVCRRARRGFARHASAGHLGHGDHARGHPSQPRALRPQPHRRHLDERYRHLRRHPATARHGYQERADNNCISVERADLVLAGCAILDHPRCFPCRGCVSPTAACARACCVR